MTRILTRRNFLKAAGLTAAGSTLACCGLGYAASQLAPPPEQAETPSFTYDKGTSMNFRILVAYASRTGSTVGVASAIGETLAGRGYHVDVQPFQENPAPGDYQAVVLGSAINGGQWLAEAKDYVTNHRQVLRQVPTALFCVHIMNLGEDEKSRKNRLAYLDAIRPMVNPQAEAFFAGVGVDPAKATWFERWAARVFHMGQGDCRDWEKIRAWGAGVFG
jgi:menaquinone-dependent protoporphyrinogen oxidase